MWYTSTEKKKINCTILQASYNRDLISSLFGKPSNSFRLPNPRNRRVFIVTDCIGKQDIRCSPLYGLPVDPLALLQSTWDFCNSFHSKCASHPHHNIIKNQLDSCHTTGSNSMFLFILEKLFKLFILTQSKMLPIYFMLEY